jgi:hypothetical protein
MEVGGQRSEVGGQRSEDLSRTLDFELLTSNFELNFPSHYIIARMPRT